MNNAKEIEKLINATVTQALANNKKPANPQPRAFNSKATNAYSLVAVKAVQPGIASTSTGAGVPEVFEELDVDSRTYYASDTVLLMPSGLSVALYKSVKSIDMYHPPESLVLKTTLKFKKTIL